MTRSRRIATLSLVASALAPVSIGCSSSSGGASDTSVTSPSGSEVAVSVVSGGLNNNSGSSVAWNFRTPRKGTAEKVLAFLNPVSTAYAADWSCSGESLSPAFNGAAGNPYAFTPPTCKVSWADGISGTSTWSGPFILNFNSACDLTYSSIEKQGAGCELVRTTATGGDTRTVTGLLDSQYEIDHDTNGAGTGWDSTVVPAPTNGGVDVTCGASGCESSATLLINGSHLTGTVALEGVSKKIWDHTVTSSALSVAVSGGGRAVSGTVTVQHNLIKATSITTFTSVTFGDPDCCFPTEGSVSTVYTGSVTAKGESLTFSATCGETTLVDDAGKSASLTLAHCL